MTPLRVEIKQPVNPRTQAGRTVYDWEWLDPPVMGNVVHWDYVRYGNGPDEAEYCGIVAVEGGVIEPVALWRLREARP